MLSGFSETVSIDKALADAVAAYGDGRLGEAESLCWRILDRDPQHIASLQVLAAVAGQLGAVHRGIELVQRVIAIDPRHVDAHIQLAKLLRLEGSRAEAVAALTKAIEFASESAAAHNDLGLIHLADGDAAEALTCFQRALEIEPDLAIGHYNRGLALERLGQHAEAAAAFRRAIVSNPSFAEAHAKLGDRLLNAGNHTEGLACFRRAIEEKPGSSFASMCEAKLLIEEGNADAAETAVRRAIERDPQNSDAYCQLGTVLMELGRFDDAAAAFDLGIALNRRQIMAYHELVHVRKLRAADRPLVAHIEWMVKEQPLGDAERADLHFALGKAYDDLAEYQRAITNFDEANRLRHSMIAPYSAAAHAALVDRMCTNFSADFFSRNAELGSDWEAPVLIVGMPRSGTTLVEQILSSHPEVAAGGELTFWGERSTAFRIDASGRIDPQWAVGTTRDYRARLHDISNTALRVTDKQPQNFHYIALIHALFPRARIIHCQRHPVDTCLSIYFQNFARPIDFACDRSDLAARYRQYLRLMAHWRSILPGQRLLEVEYEELVADPETMTRRIIDFCGLDWNEVCLHSEHNRRPVRTISVWQARQPIYQTSVARWRNYEPWLRELRELL